MIRDGFEGVVAEGDDLDGEFAAVGSGAGVFALNDEVVVGAGGIVVGLGWRWFGSVWRFRGGDESEGAEKKEEQGEAHRRDTR